MIPWVTTGNFLNGLIQYNESKEHKNDASLIHVNTMDNDLKTFKFLYKELTAETSRGKTLMHISLNFHESDKPKLSEALYTEIAQEFLMEFGFPINQPYVIYEHRDKSHPHIHIAVPMVKTTGGVINDSFSATRMIKIARKIEKKYDLKQVIEGESHKESIYQNQSQTIAKNAVLQLVSQIMTDRPASQEELEALASRTKINYNGDESFLAFEISKRGNGITFFLRDQEGVQLSKGIKGSSLPGNLSFAELQKQFAANALEKDHRLVKVRSAIQYVLSTYREPVSLEHFKTDLLNRGIILQEFYSKTGDVFGIEFQDTYTGIKFKGSELHKSLSWKGISSKVKSQTVVKHKTEENNELKPTKTMAQQGGRTIINELKSSISLIDLIERHGYTQNKKKSTSTSKVYDGPDTLLVYNHGSTGDYSGLYYTTVGNKDDKGDIVNFLINKNVVSDFGGAIKYLKNQPDYIAPVVVHNFASGTDIPKSKENVQYKSVRSAPLDLHDFLIVDRGITLDIVDKNFNGAVFTTTHEDLYDDLKSLYGNVVHKYLDKKIKPASNYTVFPIYHITTNNLVGQQLRNKGWSHMVSNSDKTNGIWHNYDATKAKIAVFENPIDAISHNTLNPDFNGSYFGTMGNPSKNIISHIAALANKHVPVLAGDNDEAGQWFNTQFLTEIIANETGAKFTISRSKQEIRISVEGDELQQHKDRLEKILGTLKEAGIQIGTLTESAEKLTLQFEKSTSGVDYSQLLFNLNQNFIYFYQTNVEVIKTKFKDFNEDLAEERKQQIKNRNTPQL